MYRARVDAVSGLKVLAGGMWLRCIGNRAVRAGDFVWTDGRCVYGHDQITQTPLVIVNPAKEDTAIPILVSGTPEHHGDNFATYTRRKGAVYHELPLSYPRGKMMINDYNDVVYCFTETSYENKQLVAANIDKSGDWFTLWFEDTTSSKNLLIRKNNSLVSTVSLNEIMAATYAQASGDSVQLTPSDERPYIIHSSTSAGIYNVTGVIDNKDSWHAFVDVRGWKRMVLVSGVGTPSEEGMDIGDIYAQRTYYINPSEQFLFSSMQEKTKGDYSDIPVSSTSDTQAVGLNVPIPDGYSFTVNSVTGRNTNGTGYPQRANITILSPSDKPVITTECNIFNQILAYHVTSELFLISIDTQGVYVARGGEKETTIFNAIKVYNQRLRPMKKYKNWWERIQAR